MRLSTVSDVLTAHLPDLPQTLHACTGDTISLADGVGLFIFWLRSNGFRHAGKSVSQTNRLGNRPARPTVQNPDSHPRQSRPASPTHSISNAEIVPHRRLSRPSHLQSNGCDLESCCYGRAVCLVCRTGPDSSLQTRLGLTSSSTIPPTSASAPTTGGIKWLSVV